MLENARSQDLYQWTELSPDPSVLHQNNALVHANALALQLFGATSGDGLQKFLGSPVSQWLQWPTLTTHPTFEGYVHRLDGRALPVEISQRKLTNPQSETVLWSIRDLTLRKKREQELLATIEERDEFLCTASHELKTPLNALQLQLQMLNRLLPPEKARTIGPRFPDLLRRAESTSHRLSRLLEQLLDLTRIKKGGIELHYSQSPVDLVQCAREVLEQMEAEAKQAGTPISLRASGPVTGKFDPDRIYQIFTNLLSNAIKYGQGTPVIVQVEKLMPEGCAKITVRDHGQGIPREEQSQLFERHQRLSNAKNGIPGMGLGLSIVKELVQAHRGKICVESPNSQAQPGAAFVIELPLS